MSVEIIEGDALTVLQGMPAGSVQTCITSPPYFGLRDYGTGEWEGGDEGCDHLGAPFRTKSSINANWGAGFEDRKNTEDREPMGANCSKCGATRIDQQLGLEPTPDAYVARLVEVFGEVKRVLRDDGTLWCNLGDSYSGSGPSGASYQSKTTQARAEGDGTDGNFRVSKRLAERGLTYAEKKPVPYPGTKPKDLLGIPWMVAFALRADGWYLRSEIIWAKPNPMPESVTDRPTKAHEQVFLLSKSPRYFYDGDAIREQGAGRLDLGTMKFGGRINGDTGWHNDGGMRDEAGRNKRSVWTIATAPYPDAHFATFPPKLIEPMVLAGCPREACGVCGAPWEREVERGELVGEDRGGNYKGREAEVDVAKQNRMPYKGERIFRPGMSYENRTTGFHPTCAHNDRTGTGTVLDPFAGSGTTLQVAIANGRSAIGIELNPEYAELARRRLVGVTPSMFDTEVSA